MYLMVSKTATTKMIAKINSTIHKHPLFKEWLTALLWHPCAKSIHDPLFKYKPHLRRL